MKIGWLAVALAAAALVAGDPALARRHHKPAPPQCADRSVEFSWFGVLLNDRPRPNGCAPAVVEYGQYIGQDPDPNIRFQLRREPSTGYESDLSK